MVASTLTRPLGTRLVAAPSSPPVDVPAGHSAASGALLIFIVILLGAVFVLGSMIRNMLASVALMLGQAVRLFGMLVLALVISLVLIAGMFANAATSHQPAPSPATPTLTPSRPTHPGHPTHSEHPTPPVARAES